VDLRPEDLAGRRWACYIRESTAGQAERYGPSLQRAEQARYAERYGLCATGLEYIDLVSGKDTLRRTDFARMLADAKAGAFEVLLCYDTSRFARNVADAWVYRDNLAQLGVTRRLLRRRAHRRQRRDLRAGGPEDRQRRGVHPPPLAQRGARLRGEVALL